MSGLVNQVKDLLVEIGIDSSIELLVTKQVYENEGSVLYTHMVIDYLRGEGQLITLKHKEQIERILDGLDWEVRLEFMVCVLEGVTLFKPSVVDVKKRVSIKYCRMK